MVVMQILITTYYVTGSLAPTIEQYYRKFDEVLTKLKRWDKEEISSNIRDTYEKNYCQL